jgi:hypothetical protein
LLSFLAACGDPESGRPPAAGDPGSPAIRFQDVTATCGVDMVMTSGRSPSTQILDVNGGGLALIDYDRDGDLDLFVANGATMDDPENGPGCRLFENLGDMRFQDVTAAAGIDVRRWAMGAAVGDYDGDGFDDLYVTCFGPNVLLHNTGDRDQPGFEDVTEAAHVADPGWGTSCAFGDVDRDGDLDLYVVNYIDFDISDPPPPSHYKGVEVLAGPHGLIAQHDVLYENAGDGTFRDITASAGCRPPEPGYGLGVAILDLNGDGYQDIFVGNDSMANLLFLNRGGPPGPAFEEAGLYSGIASNLDGSNQATMGIAIGDVDGNGRPDVFTTNFSSDTNTLHVNLDGTFFDDRTMQYGLGMISRPFLGWACRLYDFDHDGDEDLLIFNGHVYPQARRDTMDSEYEQPPLLFERRDDRFVLVPPAVGGTFLAERHRDRAAVFGDLDDDGDIDVIVGELNGPLRVLRNDGAAGDWLIVELCDERDGSKNRRGLGSGIELEATGRIQRRWIFSGGDFQSSSAPYAHFGLGPAGGGPATVALRVIWPDGFEQRIDDITPRQHLVVRRRGEENNEQALEARR